MGEWFKAAGRGGGKPEEEEEGEEELLLTPSPFPSNALGFRMRGRQAAIKRIKHIKPLSLHPCT